MPSISVDVQSLKLCQSGEFSPDFLGSLSPISHNTGKYMRFVYLFLKYMQFRYLFHSLNKSSYC